MADLPLRMNRRSLLRLTGTIGGTCLFGTTAAAGGRDPLDRYIVGVESRRADVARRAAASVYRVLDFGDRGQAVSGWYPEEALAGLRRNPNVRYVEPEGTMEAIGHTTDEGSASPYETQVLPWGVDRVDAEVAHHNGDDGSAGSIAVIDTGIDPTHVDLSVTGGRNFSNCDNEDDSAACADEWTDGHGHGTHCAGIANALNNDTGVVGTSSASALYAVKVLDDDGGGTYSDVAAGITWTADQGIDVGSLSLGGSASQVVEDACVYAYGEGTLLVAAAGNDGSHPAFSTVGYPAAYDEVIAVSATDANDDIASFSSRGSEVELAAPGVDILSSLPGDSYDRWNGTSMACPHVSGAGAQVMAGGASNTEARNTLDGTAQDIGLSAREQGNGLVDVAAALGHDSSDDLREEPSNAAPSVSWRHPADGATVSGSVSIEIEASDSDGTVGTVEFYVDGTKVSEPADGDGDGVYTDTWDSTAVADGTHTLEARATDDDGATSSASISVTVDNVDSPPSVSWVNPTDGETVGGTSVSIAIDASDDNDSGGDLTVEWQVDDGSWRPATDDDLDGVYTASWDSTTVADGSHTLDARATDATGNTSSEASVSVTVDNTADPVSIDTFRVGESGSPNPHLEISVEWAVSGSDLRIVRVSAEDADGTAFGDTHVYDSLGGSSAAGVDEFTFKHADGETATVTIYVEEADGDNASRTDQVTE